MEFGIRNFFDSAFRIPRSELLCASVEILWHLWCGGRHEVEASSRDAKIAE